MRYLVISDLDGTLLNKKSRMSNEISDRLNRLIRYNDIFFTFATSRDYIDLVNVKSNVNINVPVILCNGAILLDYKTGNVISGVYFKEEVTNIILNALFNNSLEVKIVCEINGQLQRFTISSKSKEISYEKIVSISVINEIEHLKSFFAKTKYHFNKFSCVNLYNNPYDSCSAILDFTPLDISKGRAVRLLKEIINCELFVVSFGDGCNDISLIEEADYGFSVGKCSNKLIDISNKNIDYSEGNSVVTEIEKIINMGV